MSQAINRRLALSAFLSLPAFALVGCSGGDPNQFVSGTMVKPLESVERADEEAAKKFEANARSKGSRKSRR